MAEIPEANIEESIREKKPVSEDKEAEDEGNRSFEEVDDDDLGDDLNASEEEDDEDEIMQHSMQR